MKFSKVAWIASALVVYMVFLIANLPANQVLGRISLPDNVAVSGISGNIWHANAANIRVNGISIDQVNLKLAALPLILGNASIYLDGGNKRATDDVSVKGHISLPLSGSGAIQARELQAFFPTSLIVSQLPLPVPVVAQGRMRLDINSLDFDQSCQQLDGALKWLNAAVGSNGGLVDLGSFDADLACEQGNTLIKIKEPNMLGLSADAKLDAKLDYSIEGRFKPDTSLPKSVHDASVIFGRKDAQGYYQLKL